MATITTTRPVFPPYPEQSILKTSYPGLSFRPFQVDDLTAFHELRTQIEVMQWTSTGKVDADLQATRTWMNRFMKIENDLENTADKEIEQKIKEASSNPHSFNLAIVYDGPSKVLGNGNSGSAKVIGVGGCHILNPNPECGYMIRKEYWGLGIATAFLQAFVEAYWRLERKSVRLPKDTTVDLDLLERHLDVKPGEDSVNVQEYLAAVIVTTNTGSRRVLEKCNFQHLSNESIEEFGEQVELGHYILPRPPSHLQ